jgi:hypothetical protein
VADGLQGWRDDMAGRGVFYYYEKLYEAEIDDYVVAFHQRVFVSFGTIRLGLFVR